MVRQQNHPRLSRRQLMSILGAAGATGLAGCSGDGGGDGSPTVSSTPTDKPTPNAQINFWSKETQQARTQLISGLAQDFNQNNPGEVSPVYIAEEGIDTQLTAAISSNTVPEVLQGRVQILQQLANEDLIAEDKLADVMDSIGRDEFREGPLNFLKSPDGGHIGIPMDGWATAIYYRKSAFDEKGLNPPTTWEDTLEAAKEFHDPDNNQYGIGIGTNVAAYLRQTLAHWGLANGVRVFDENGNIAFDSPETVELLEHYAELGQYTAPGDVTFTMTRQNYENERNHMTFWSPYIMDDILNHVGQDMVDDTAVSPFMEKTQKASYGIVNSLTISSLASADEQAIATDWVEFLMSGQNYIDWLHMAPGGKQPMIKSVAEKDAYQSNDVLNAWGDTVQDVSGALNNAKRWGIRNGQSFPAYGSITAKLLIAKAGKRALNGEDPQAVASDTASKMEQEL